MSPYVVQIKGVLMENERSSRLEDASVEGQEKVCSEKSNKSMKAGAGESHESDEDARPEDEEEEAEAEGGTAKSSDPSLKMPELPSIAAAAASLLPLPRLAFKQFKMLPLRGEGPTLKPALKRSDDHWNCSGVAY